MTSPHLPDDVLAAEHVPAAAEGHLSRCPRCRVQRRLFTRRTAVSEQSALGTVGKARGAVDSAVRAVEQLVGEGSSLGPYTLSEWLQSRHTGMVYRATDGDGLEVELEVFSSPCQAGGLLELAHPHLARVVAADEAGRWMARERVEGVLLVDALGEASLGRWMALALQLASALAALHAAGRTHGGLSRQSARVSPSGPVVVVDGIGRALPVGQPGAAPEGVAAPAADWFSFERILRDHVPPDALARGPAQVLELFERMRDPAPSERPTTVEVLATLLAHHQPSEAHASRYADQGLLGQGGMGVVYRAFDPLLRRRVALKVLGSKLDGPSHTSRFVAEAQVTAQLQHPGIVPVHEMSRLPDGTPYFTMKEVLGRTLARVIRDAVDGLDTSWPLTRRVDAFRRCCEAVSYAHARGVVHRDLKPGNVMIGDFGEVLVLDWGLAAVYDAGVPKPVVADFLPRTGRAEGTPGYMPAEQRAGREDAIGPRADVYALGAMLWEVFSGAPPDEPARAEGPAELVSVAQKAMATRPGDRYASAAELKQDVESWLAGGRVRAHVYTKRERLGRTLRPYQTHLVVGSVGVALFAALAAAGARIQDQQGVNARAEAMVLAEKAQNALLDGDRVGAYAHAAASVAVQDSPTARGILASVGRGWMPSLSARPVQLEAPCVGLATAGDEVVCASAQDVTAFAGSEVAWMHEGSAVGLASAGTALVAAGDTVVVLDAGRVVQTFQSGGRDPSRMPGGFAWVEADRAVFLPDGGEPVRSPSLGGAVMASTACGDRLLLSTIRGVWAWDPTEGALERVLGATGAQGLACDPSGARLAIRSDHDILLWSVDPPVETARIHEHDGPITSVQWDPAGRRLASTAADGSVRIWDAQRLSELARLPGDERGGQVAFSADGETLVASTGGLLRSWSLVEPSSRGEIDAMVPLSSVGWTGASEVATLDRNGVLRLFDTESGRRTGRLRLLGQALSAVASMPTGALLAVGLCDGTVQGVVKGSMTPLWTAELGSGCVVATTLSGDGALLAGATAEGRIGVWKADDGTPVWATDLARPIRRLQFDATGVQLLVSTDTVALLVGEGGAVVELPGEATASALGPRGEVQALAREDGSIELVREGRKQRALVGHTEAATALAFSADGRLLASASRDRTVRLWNAVTGEEVARLRGHQRGARSVAFSADDATLASVDTDGKVRFWDLTLVTAEPEFLLAEAQRRFGATPAASTIHYGGAQ